MPRRPATVTSPAASGVFLFPSASPLNGTAFAPPLPHAAALPSALPLCPVRPFPPRLAAADKPRRPRRATAAACDPLSLCRFPCPVPPVSRAALGKPRPAALAPPGKARQPLAVGDCRPQPPLVIHAAAAGGKKGRFTKQR